MKILQRCDTHPSGKKFAIGFEYMRYWLLVDGENIHHSYQTPEIAKQRASVFYGKGFKWYNAPE